MLRKVTKYEKRREAVRDSIKAGPFLMSNWCDCIAGHAHKVMDGDDAAAKFRLYMGEGLLQSWFMEAASFLGMSQANANSMFFANCSVTQAQAIKMMDDLVLLELESVGSA